MAGRPRFQKGTVTVRGGMWVLRYRDYNNNGKKAQFALGSVADNPDIRESETTKAEARFVEEISKGRVEINQGHTARGISLTVGEFIEQSYWTRLVWRLQASGELHIEPTTVDGYKDIYRVHVKDSAAAKIPLRNFKPIDARRFVEGLNQELSHQTHLRIKNFMSGVFTWAITDEAYSGTNPMDGVKAGGWTRQSQRPDPKNERERKIRASNEHRYNLGEVADMMAKLPEPARTVCAVAAFTGLTKSELRGLKWGDIRKASKHEEYDGTVIKVQRKVVDTHIGSTKTDQREAEVPLLPLVEDILAKYKKTFPEVVPTNGKPGDGWIFRGEKKLQPLDLDNLSRREIPPHIKGNWRGFHAFRRGIATRLEEFAASPKITQLILRHADIKVGQAHYNRPEQKQVELHLKKIEAVAKEKYGIKV
jgi:integrase